MNDKLVHFPIKVDIGEDYIVVQSYVSMIESITALRYQKQYQSMDWDSEDERTLEALETLKGLCDLYGYGD